LIRLPTGKTLLESTVQRVMPLCPEPASRYIVTTAEYASAISAMMHITGEQILIEPAPKNTAPAILWSCLQIVPQHPDAVILFVPSDHVIEDDDAYRAALEKAYAAAEHFQELVLIGIKPTGSSTQYGFIEKGSAKDAVGSVHRVRKFHEKPDQVSVSRYLESADMLWNSGMVCAPVKKLIELFQEHAPDICRDVDRYEQVPARSFDYAVLEKSVHTLIVEGAFRWKDMGSLLNFIPAFSSNAESHVALAGSERVVVSAQKPVITAGVSDLCIVEMEDMILVLHRDLMDRPDIVATELEKRGRSEYV